MINSPYKYTFCILAAILEGHITDMVILKSQQGTQVSIVITKVNEEAILGE